jgi:putative transposase
VITARHDHREVSPCLLYLIFSRLLSWLTLLARAPSSKDIELLVSYAMRSLSSAEPPLKPRLDWADRAMFAALIQCLPAALRDTASSPRPRSCVGIAAW